MSDYIRGITVKTVHALTQAQLENVLHLLQTASWRSAAAAAYADAAPFAAGGT